MLRISETFFFSNECSSESLIRCIYKAIMHRPTHYPQADFANAEWEDGHSSTIKHLGANFQLCECWLRTNMSVNAIYLYMTLRSPNEESKWCILYTPCAQPWKLPRIPKVAKGCQMLPKATDTFGQRIAKAFRYTVQASQRKTTFQPTRSSWIVISQPREARVISLHRLTRAEMRRRRGLPGVPSLRSIYLAVRRWIITSMILGTMSRISLS